MPDFGALGTFIAAIGGAFAAILGGYVTWRKARREERSESHMQITTLLDNQAKRISEMEARESERVRRERVMLDYIFQLQLHIVDRNPPPPPRWPKSLLPPNEE